MVTFGRKDDEIVDGVRGLAVLRDFERSDFWDEHEGRHGDTEPIRLADLGIGNYTYRFVLEVTLDDGRAPYAVNEKFKVPSKAGGGINVGTRIPVTADPKDPNQLELDWDAWFAPGGAGERLTWGDAEFKEEVHEAMPEPTRSMMVEGWVKALTVGNMTREQFDEALDGAVKGGMLTADEAGAARARL